MFVLVLASLPAGAFHDPGLPELASDALISGEWVSYKMLAEEGAALDVEVVMQMDGASAAWTADWVIFEDGRGSGLTSVRSGRGTRVVIPPAGVLIEDDPTPQSGGGFGVASTYSGLSAGPITVIVGAVANGGAVQVDVVISGSSVSLVDVLRGDGTFAYDDESFDPELHVRGPSGLVELAANGSVTVTAPRALYAWFVTNHEISQTRYIGPARSETSTTLNGFGWIILDGEPAGEHAFHLDLAAGPVFTGWALVGIPAGG